MENYIVINGQKHEFVIDQSKRDNCSLCSLRDEICYKKLGVDSQLCKIFMTEEITNGYFEKK